ncbi:hypothetical protein NPIL_155661 [Nephila pilipes]|uniref:Uncharacterized protein n=1 Tax=Nephila pilipes TaxID=299642 RepID=A0A8X6PFM8_NEPPI|nr:hypothetical protein NPIL_649661 [Nephila pilipes]GFT64736.1 hypothetical protein NPIL_155661 [Nephila pilipes]
MTQDSDSLELSRIHPVEKKRVDSPRRTTVAHLEVVFYGQCHPFPKVTAAKGIHHILRGREHIALYLAKRYEELSPTLVLLLDKDEDNLYRCKNGIASRRIHSKKSVIACT